MNYSEILSKYQLHQQYPVVPVPVLVPVPVVLLLVLLEVLEQLDVSLGALLQGALLQGALLGALHLGALRDGNTHKTHHVKYNRCFSRIAVRHT